mmetsp:Transcript_97083/g.277798  ORF Transcript_97083/g.277798 Transcript_97083/m.277798 type:complete len:531 (-) Transcript_97083:198-1790(-)
MPRPTVSPEPTSTPVDCPATCTVTATFGDFGGGQELISDVTCDDAIQNEQLREQLGDNYDIECSTLENDYNCDCGGCACAPLPTVPPAPTVLEPTPAPGNCPSTCTVTLDAGGFTQDLISDVTCDEAIQNEQLREQLGDNYDIECSTLEVQHNCDCGGCTCAPLPTTSPTHKPTSAVPTLAPNPIPTVTPGNPTRTPTQRPTILPTSTPSLKPTTLAPTLASYTTVTWSDALTLSGVVASEIDTEGENAIKVSIASASEFVSATSITITAITDISRRLQSGTAAARQGVVDLGRGGGGRELATSGVTVSYDTIVILESTTFDDTADLFDNVAAAVETYVTSGDFETALQTHESMASVEVDEDAYVKPTEFVVAFPPSPAPSLVPSHVPSSEPVSPSGAKAAGGLPIAIIGVGAAVVVILAVAGYACGGKKKGKVAAAPPSALEMAPTAPAPPVPAAPGGQPIQADSVPLEVAVAVATPIETACGAQHSNRDAHGASLLAVKGGFNPEQQAPPMFDPHTGQRIRGPGLGPV